MSVLIVHDETERDQRFHKWQHTFFDETQVPAGAAAHDSMFGCGNVVDTYRVGIRTLAAAVAEIRSAHVGASRRTEK